MGSHGAQGKQSQPSFKILFSTRYLYCILPESQLMSAFERLSIFVFPSLYMCDGVCDKQAQDVLDLPKPSQKEGRAETKIPFDVVNQCLGVPYYI